MNENKNNQMKVDQNEILLQYLLENEEKLKILLSGNKGSKPLIYPIKGKRTTKTIFMSEKLQFLMNEYCIEKEIKIGDLVECAIIQHFVQNGYEDKITPILNDEIDKK